MTSPVVANIGRNPPPETIQSDRRGVARLGLVVDRRSPSEIDTWGSRPGGDRPKRPSRPGSARPRPARTDARGDPVARRAEPRSGPLPPQNERPDPVLVREQARVDPWRRGDRSPSPRNLCTIFIASSDSRSIRSDLVRRVFARYNVDPSRASFPLRHDRRRPVPDAGPSPNHQARPVTRRTRSHDASH